MACECGQAPSSSPPVPPPLSPPPDSSPPVPSPPISLPDPSTESTSPVVFPSVPVPVSVPVSFPVPTSDVVMSTAPRVPPVPHPLDPVDVKKLTRLMLTKVKPGSDVSALTKLARSLVKSHRLIVSSTPAVANTAIRRSRDRASHIPVAAIQAAKAALGLGNFVNLVLFL